MDAGHITPGVIDDRSIEEVSARDVAEHERVHFFAGIGGWELALRISGWRGRVWAGSCPCQPLSSAGQRKGHVDERHLWPAFHRLIAECQPAVVFGEQVASKDGREWFAAVRADLERLGYACGGADMPAASVGAPHIRQRLWWVADADGGVAHPKSNRTTLQQEKRQVVTEYDSNGRGGERCSVGNGADADGGCEAGRAADSGRHGEDRPSRLAGASGDGCRDEKDRRRHEGVSEDRKGSGRIRFGTKGRGETCGLGDSDQSQPRTQGGRKTYGEGDSGSTSSWHAELISCADGKARPVEPGICPLAHGVPGRVGRLRAYGNAIVPQVAAEFVAAFMECRP